MTIQVQIGALCDGQVIRNVLLQHDRTHTIDGGQTCRQICRKVQCFYLFANAVGTQSRFIEHDRLKGAARVKVLHIGSCQCLQLTAALAFFHNSLQLIQLLLVIDEFAERLIELLVRQLQVQRVVAAGAVEGVFLAQHFQRAVDIALILRQVDRLTDRGRRVDDRRRRHIGIQNHTNVVIQRLVGDLAAQSIDVAQVRLVGQNERAEIDLIHLFRQVQRGIDLALPRLERNSVFLLFQLVAELEHRIRNAAQADL